MPNLLKNQTGKGNIITERKWKGKEKKVSFSAVTWNISTPTQRLTSSDNVPWRNNHCSEPARVWLRSTRHQPWSPCPKRDRLSLGGEFGGGQERGSAEMCMLTLQSVYIPEGNFSPRWEKARGGGGNMSLGLVSVRRASRHSGGTWTSGWYVNTHMQTHTNIDLLEEEKIKIKK